ncbi:MAG TPA: CHASE3 domain-containing protein [Rariglobus sp.]
MKPARPLLLSRPLVSLGLLVGFLLAAGTAAISAISTRGIVSAGTRVVQTQAILLEINQLLSSLIDAETGQRGYILTGLETYLEPYTRASSRLDNQLAALRVRFENSPGQLSTLNHITGLVAEKKTEMNRTIALRRDSAIGPALHIVDSGAGLTMMNALREDVRKLEQNELADLAFHSANVGRRARIFQTVNIGMLVSAIVLAATGAWMLLRRVHELETMITVCAWTHRVKFDGAWISFEEYLRKRFKFQFTHGISEEASNRLKQEAVEIMSRTALKPNARPGPAPGEDGKPPPARPVIRPG